MPFKPASPPWLLPFCNARCIVTKEEKPNGQECHPAHRQGEEVREARRGLLQPDHQFGMILRPRLFDDALECLRSRRCNHPALFAAFAMPKGSTSFRHARPRVRKTDQELKSRTVLPGKMRQVEAEQAEEGDPSMAVALGLIIPVI